MKCVIPCAGESSRMSYIPKHLVRICDKPLLTHIIDMWKDSVDSFVFVMKRSMTYMWEYLPENSAIVFQDEPRGLADAVLRAERYTSDKFVVALGDCLHKGKFEEPKPTLGIGVWETHKLTEVNKSYLVEGAKGRIHLLVEKPNIPSNIPGPWSCGMGTYFFDTRVFDYIRAYKGPSGGGDLTHVIQDMIDAGEEIRPMWFKGKYINIGSPEDIKRAERVLR